MDTSFSVGDRVMCVNPVSSNYSIVGEIGVIAYQANGDEYAVRFEKNIGGHDCDGCVQYGYGWWLSSDDLVKFSYEYSYDDFMHIDNE